MPDPRKIFPPETVELHDKRGIPWPNWFAGPLYPEDGVAEALAAFEEYLQKKSHIQPTDPVPGEGE